MILNILLSQIDDNPWQTRRHYDDDYIAELAADIARNGLLQLPNGRLLMRGSGLVLNSKQIAKFEIDRHLLNDDDVRVQLAIGHNRIRAYRLLAASDDAFTTIPVQVAAYDDQQMACMAWSENEQRRDLSPLEQAQAIAHAIESFGWTHEEVAERFGLNRATITNKLRLLILPDEVGSQLHTGALSERQAMTLVPLYTLPGPTQQLLDMRGGWMTRKEIVSRAIDGASSDMLRQWAGNTLRDVLGKFDEKSFPPDQQVAEGHDQVHHGRCTDCQFKIKQDGIEMCGDVRCFEVKTESWRSYCLGMAQRHVKFPCADPKRSVWDFEGFNATEQMGAAIIERGCPKERLRLYYDPGRNIGVRVQGVTDVRVVCDIEDGKGCQCLRAERKRYAQETGANAIEEEEKALKKQLREEVSSPAIQALEAALAATQQLEAWRIVVRAISYSLSENVLDALPEKFCHDVAKKTIESMVHWGSHHSQNETRELISKRLSPAGIDPYPDTAQKTHNRNKQYQYRELMPELAYDWLAKYSDKHGRAWSGLEDNQVYHANSPCYQAFVQAFPGLTDPKLYLKTALARLRKEAQESAAETAADQVLDGVAEYEQEMAALYEDEYEDEEV